MNGESGIRNPESRELQASPSLRAGGAPWLIWLGALFVLSVVPLQHQLESYWMSGALDLQPGRSVAAYEFYIRNHGIYFVFFLAFILPSLVRTFFTATPRSDRALLVAFLPLSALAVAVARDTGQVVPVQISGATQVPILLAVLLPSGGAIGVVVAYVVGVPSAALAPIARRLLAADVLWIILLQWNETNFAARYVPGWVGAAGAAMILLGEILPRPAPVILDS